MRLCIKFVLSCVLWLIESGEEATAIKLNHVRSERSDNYLNWKK
jgi:hypothetical protein